MIIEIDAVPVDMVPQSLDWREPPLLAKSGVGAPILAPYWSATLSINIPTVVDTYPQWFELRDGTRHIFTLPHPYTGVITDYYAYVDSVEGRYDIRGECPVMMGVDIALSRITV